MPTVGRHSSPPSGGKPVVFLRTFAWRLYGRYTDKGYEMDSDIGFVIRRPDNMGIGEILIEFEDKFFSSFFPSEGTPLTKIINMGFL